MLSFLKKISLILLAGALTSCTYVRNSWIENRDTDYLKAYSVAPLVIPPGLSSSTIQAHYPVPERNYPPCTQRMNLTPPELVQYVPTRRKAIREPVCAEPMPASRPIMSIAVPFARHPATPAASEQQGQTASNYYYDSFTRSGSRFSNKSGVPVGALFPARSAKATSSAPLSTAPATGNNMKSPAPAPLSNSPNSPQNRGILNSLNSIWPWSHNTPTSAPTTAVQQPASQPATHSAAVQPASAPTTNSAENTTEQKKDIKQFQYYDRFTRS